MITREWVNGVSGVLGRWNGTSRISRWLAAYVFFSTTAIVISSSAAEPDADTTDQKVPRQSAALKVMRELAAAPTVSLSFQNDPARSIKLMTEPLMHFGDPEINILDAVLWAYGDRGRPHALLKIEAHRWPDDLPPRITWGQSFYSLSDNNLQAVWPNGRSYETREPGLKLETFPDGPRPAGSERARLTQMKQLARRFSARCLDESKDDLEMRLVPTPIYRYADPEADVQDGAIFAFSSSGTNPTLVLLVEVSQPQGEPAKWQYSLQRMTVRQMTVKLEGRTVYEAAYTGLNPVKEPTWMWFFEKGTLAQEEKEE